MCVCKHCNREAVLSNCCLECWLTVEHFIDPKDWESTGCYRINPTWDEERERFILSAESRERLRATYAPFQETTTKTDSDGEEIEVEVGPYSFAIYVCEWAIRLGGGVWVMPRQEFPGDKPVAPELRPDVAIPVGPQKRVILAPQGQWMTVLSNWASDMGVLLADIKVERRKDTFGSQKAKPDFDTLTEDEIKAYKAKKRKARQEADKKLSPEQLAAVKALRKTRAAQKKELAGAEPDPTGLWWSERTEKLVVTIKCNHRHFSDEQLSEHAALWHGGDLGRRRRPHIHRLHVYDEDRNWGKVHHNHSVLSEEELVEHLREDHISEDQPEGYVLQYPGDPGPWLVEHAHNVTPLLMENGVLVNRLGDLSSIHWRKEMMDSDAKVKGIPWAGVPDYRIKVRRKTAKYTMAKGQSIAVPWDHDATDPNKKIKGGHTHAWYFESGVDRTTKYAKHLKDYHQSVEPERDWFHPHERSIKNPNANMAKRISTHHDYLPRLAEAKVGFWSKEGLLKMHTLLRMGHAAFAVLSVTLGRAPELEWVVKTYLSHLEVIVQTVDSDAAIKSEVLRQTVIDGLVLQTMGFDRTQLLIAAPRRVWKNQDGSYTHTPIKGQPEEKVGIDDPMGRDWKNWVTYSIEPPLMDEVMDWLKMAGVKDIRNRTRDAIGLIKMAEVAGPSGRVRMNLDMIEKITGFDRKKVKRMIDSWRATGLVKSRPDDYKLGKPRKYTVLEQFRGVLHESPLMDWVKDYYPEEGK